MGKFKLLFIYADFTSSCRDLFSFNFISDLDEGMNGSYQYLKYVRVSSGLGQVLLSSVQQQDKGE